MNPSAVPFVPTWLRSNNASASPSNNNLDISDDSRVQFEFEDDGGFGGEHAREARAFSHASSSSSLAGSRDGTSTPNQGFGSPVQTAFAGLSLRGSGSQPTTPSRRTHSAQPYLPYGDSKPMLIKTKSMTDAAALHNLVGPSSMQTPPLSTSGSSLTEALRGAPGLAPAPAPSSPARGLAASVDDDDLNDAGAVDAQRTAVEVEEEAAAPAVASTDDEVADALDDVPAPTTSSSPPRTTLRIDPNKPVGPDDFEVLCVVGQGAFGKVFQVRRIGDGRIYAMKVMRKDRIISRMQGYFDDAAAAAAAAAATTTTAAATPQPPTPESPATFPSPTANDASTPAAAPSTPSTPNTAQDVRNECSTLRHTFTERDILTRVRHPYIVALRYSFQTPAKLYLVLDFINGGHLFYQLYRHGTFSEAWVRVYAAELALAIGHLHQLGILHRDLKPENILLGADGHVVVTDFGLAKSDMEHDDSRTNSLVGTMHYMAPEIITGKGHSRPADWWSVGILVYEMLTGKPPFDAKNKSLLQKAICKDKVKLPSFLTSDAGTLVKALLHKDPKARLGAGPASDGLKAIQASKFFLGFPWKKLEAKEMPPPFVPAVQDEHDTCNFDEMYTQLPPMDSPANAPQLLAGVYGDPFAGFSFRDSAHERAIFASSLRSSGGQPSPGSNSPSSPYASPYAPSSPALRRTLM